MKEWQQRPLESIYAVVFMDAIHYNVRCEGRIGKKAVDEETALYELEQFAAKWDSKYSKISASWKAHWSDFQLILSIRNR